jgi:hypothetical protein
MEIKTDPNSIWTIKDFGNYGKDGGDFSGPNPDQFSMDFENSKGFFKSQKKDPFAYSVGKGFDMSGGEAGLEVGLGPITSDAKKNMAFAGDLLGIKAAEEAAQIQADAIKEAASKQARAARNSAIIGAGVTIGAALI